MPPTIILPPDRVVAVLVEVVFEVTVADGAVPTAVTVVTWGRFTTAARVTCCKPATEGAKTIPGGRWTGRAWLTMA